VSAPLLTTRQVAERFGVGSETILRWVRSGRLPAIRISTGAIRFRESEIEAWLDEHATAAPGRESASNPDRRRQRNGILPVPAIPLPMTARDEED
jgi:excisionase family DNA binding protein